MKKSFFTLLASITLAIVWPGLANAQMVVEPNNSLDSGIKPLNEVILGDTLADGSRVNTVYELKRDGYYVLSGELIASGFDLKLIGQSGAGELPIVIMGTNEEGGDASWNRISCNGNMELRNIRFPVINSMGGRGWNQLIGFQGEGKTLLMDGCIVDFNDGSLGMNDAATNQSWIFTNNLFRYNGQEEWGGSWTGFGPIIKRVDLEMVYYENNTFVDCIAPILVHEAGVIKNFWFNHNTIVNNAQFLMRSEYWSQAIMMNNLFVNAHFAGETVKLRDGQDPDKLPYGVVTVAAPSAEGDTLGLSPAAQRVFALMLNNNYVSPEIKAFWLQAAVDFDSVDYQVADVNQYDGFLNSRALSMLADKTTYPLFHLGTIKSENPGFTDFTFNFQGMINHARSMFGQWSIDETVRWGGHPEGNDMMLFPVAKDVFDLSYSNDNLKTGGYQGYPMGDLNWFPDVKTSWEADANKETYESILAKIKAGTFTSVKKTMQGVSGLQLSQNFPNPVSSTTTISFHIPEATHVSLNVYNVFGQLVANLVNEPLSAGAHERNFGVEKLSNGMYFYKLQAGGNSMVQKMQVAK
jgi:hypothetical protein